MGQPAMMIDRQGCERLFKLSDWRLVLELGASGGNFKHLQWQWKSSIWSSVNCVVSTMLRNWSCSLNIFNAKKSIGGHVKKFLISSFYNRITFSQACSSTALC